MTQSKNVEERRKAAEALGYSFALLSDKEQAWCDLHTLTQDKDDSVRNKAAYSLGATFTHIPERHKEQAWSDLISLGRDYDVVVRITAYHSLGKTSIFKATESENDEDFKKELEKALEYFEIASKEIAIYSVLFKKSFFDKVLGIHGVKGSIFWKNEAGEEGNDKDFKKKVEDELEALKKFSYYDPARFCLPFYRSFYLITFGKQEVREEVEKNLAEARSATEGSKGKKKLLEAVENLSNALIEIKKATDMSLEGKKSELNVYKRYCDQVIDLLDATEEKTPGAAKLIRKGLPIIDKKIGANLRKIEENAKKFCKESKGTSFETISRDIYEYTKGLGDTKNPIIVMIRLDKLTPLLHHMCEILPKESSRVICDQLENIKEAELPNKADIVLNTLSCIMVQMDNMQERLTEKDKRLEYLEDRVLLKLDNISYGVSKLKLRSGEIAQSLYEIQNELYRLNAIQADLIKAGLSIEKLENRQHQELNRLNDEITRLVGEIEADIIPKLPPNNDATEEILEKLQDLKISKEEAWFNRGAGLASIIGLILSFKSIL